MRRPKCNRVYFFVRAVGDRIEYVELIRFDDDSLTYVIDGKLCEVDEDLGGWRKVVDALQNSGYVEAREAKAKGIIPDNWIPTATCLRALL
jgi:hypothetical protein